MVDKRLNQAKPRNNESSSAVELRVSPPQVRVASPKVDVKVAAPQLNMDMSALNKTMASLAQSVAAIAQQQATLLQVIREHHGAINAAMSNQPAIKVEAPQIKMAARPSSFYVELDNEDGETVGMRVRAKSPN
jgi:hypothetical protein